MMSRHRPKSHRRQGGFSLIEAAVAAGIVGVVALILSRHTEMFVAAETKARAEQDAEIILGNVIRSMSCYDTFLRQPEDIKTSTCNGPIALFSEDGEVVVSADNARPTRMGKWVVRATCHNSLTDPESPADPAAYRRWGVDVSIARPLPTVRNVLDSRNPSDFRMDQITNRTWSWAHPKSSLTSKTLRLCARGFLDEWPSGP